MTLNLAAALSSSRSSTRPADNAEMIGKLSAPVGPPPPAGATFSLDALRTYLGSEEKHAARVTYLAICPDCGKVELHRWRCPKCGGDSWMTAASLSFEHALRIRKARALQRERITGADGPR